MTEMVTKITKDTIIGDIIQLSPEIEKIIAKHFGTSCFTCPGVKMESIAFGAMMHNLDPEPIVNEINAILEKNKKQSEGLSPKPKLQS